MVMRLAAEMSGTFRCADVHPAALVCDGDHSKLQLQLAPSFGSL